MANHRAPGDLGGPPEPTTRLPGAARASLEQLLADRLDQGWELYKVEHLSDDEELVFLRRPGAESPGDPA